MTDQPVTLPADMLDALDITADEAEGLAELARHDLALARDFARRAQAAEDADEANRLARSYQRAARSYRQTLALKARLKRDLAAAAKVQADTPKVRPGVAAVSRRLRELRTALLRLAWDEAERIETETEVEDDGQDGGEDGGEGGGFHDAAGTLACLRHDIDLTLARAELSREVCDEPLDDHVTRLALDLGYPPAAIARWRDLPDPPAAALDAHVDDDHWRSSA